MLISSWILIVRGARCRYADSIDCVRACVRVYVRVRERESERHPSGVKLPGKSDRQAKIKNKTQIQSQPTIMFVFMSRRVLFVARLVIRFVIC